MAEGFRIAEAFVEIETEDNTRRGLSQVNNSVMKWGDKLAKKVTGYFSTGFNDGTAAALKATDKLRDDTIRAIEDINAKKLRIDADVLRASAKIKDLAEKAKDATGDRKIQFDADIAAAEAKLLLMKREADKLANKHIELKVDLDRHNATRAMADVGRQTVRWSTKLGGLITTLLSEGFGAAFEVGMGLLKNLFSNTAEGVSKMATQVATGLTGAAVAGAGMTAATGGLNIVLGILATVLLAVYGTVAALTVGFLVLAPAVSLVGGAFGSMFTLVAGGIASVAVLKLGLSGIGTALKEIGKDGKVSNETLAKLSPNARKLVKELAKLKKPLDDLRKFVQDKLLDDMGDRVKDLANKWLPQLRPMLGDLATRFNNFAKSIFDALGKPDFIENIKEAVKGFGGFLDRLGESMGPLIDSFGRLAKASVPFLKELGDIFGDMIDDFAAWIKKADETGALEDFMTNAAKALRDIWDIGKLVFGIGKEIIEIFFPSSDKASDSFLGGVKKFLQDVKDWLADPENQKKIKDFATKIQEFITWFVTVGMPTIKSWILKIDEWIAKIEAWADKIKNWKATLNAVWDEMKRQAKEKWDQIVAYFQGLPGRIGSALAQLGPKVREKIVSMSGEAGRLIGSFIGSAINTFASLPGRAASAIASLPGRIVGVFNTARGQGLSTVTSFIGSAISILSSLPGRAASALGGLGGVLVAAGRALIGGLIQGIKDKVPSLTGLLNWISDMIPGEKGPIEKDRKLLVPAGQAIMGGLMKGIDSQVPVLENQLQSLTGAIGSMGARSRPAASGAAYHFAAGSIVLDASKIKSIEDLIKMIQGLKTTARRHGAQVAVTGMGAR